MALKLFVSDACSHCDEVKRWIVGQSLSIEQVRVKKDLRSNRFFIRRGLRRIWLNELPAVPALLDGMRLIVGTGITQYLREIISHIRKEEVTS